MTGAAGNSPALVAAREAETLVRGHLQRGENFLLEAGAGAGKTYSLIETLRFLIEVRGPELRSKGQRIACLTYTNAATAVIASRIDSDPLVYIDTLHAFCWAAIRGFQSVLRQRVAMIPEWQDRLAEVGGIGPRSVLYDLGHRRVRDDAVYLHHDDVLTLVVALLPAIKFQDILTAQFPIVLIDEYQDTNAEVMNAVKANLLTRTGGPLIGLFGDHWQRIYEKTCGHVTHDQLQEVGKRANFRSAKAIVSALNKMRPELEQAVKDETFIGSAAVYHTNSWQGTRRTGAGGGHWKGDLPQDEAHRYLHALKDTLAAEGWVFAPNRTKVLMLTHGVLASEQGYSALADAFTYTDSFIKKEDDYIAFFSDHLEPACAAFVERRYGAMFELLGSTAPKLGSHSDKARWSQAMAALVAIREAGTIGDVVAHIAANTSIILPEAVSRREREARDWRDKAHEEGAVPDDKVVRTLKLQAVPYSQVIAVHQFVNGHTPFATKHSVKGDEFENVLVVLGRGWNKYNFGQFLEWAAQGAPADKQETFERNRNLFYVSCSRPTTRLALLFTQELSAAALGTLHAWFGEDKVHDYQP